MTYYVTDFVLGLEISNNEINILYLKYSQPKSKYINVSIICEKHLVYQCVLGVSSEAVFSQTYLTTKPSHKKHFTGQQ